MAELSKSRPKRRKMKEAQAVEMLAAMGLKPGDRVEVEYDDSSGRPICTSRRVIRTSGETVELPLEQRT